MPEFRDEATQSGTAGGGNNQQRAVMGGKERDSHKKDVALTRRSSEKLKLSREKTKMVIDHWRVVGQNWLVTLGTRRNEPKLDVQSRENTHGHMSSALSP